MSATTRFTEIAVEPGRCACGAMAAGYDAVRETAVCPACAAVVGGGES